GRGGRAGGGGGGGRRRRRRGGLGALAGNRVPGGAVPAQAGEGLLLLLGRELALLDVLVEDRLHAGLEAGLEVGLADALLVGDLVQRQALPEVLLELLRLHPEGLRLGLEHGLVDRPRGGVGGGPAGGRRGARRGRR